MVFGDLVGIDALLDGEFVDYARKLWLPILAMSTEQSK
jgi:hypothetical protein